MASNVSNPKKMTITIRIVDEGTITFKQWYTQRTAAYASEAEALKHWEAMCVGTQGLVVCDKDEGEFEDYEEWFWDIEEENKPEEEDDDQSDVLSTCCCDCGESFMFDEPVPYSDYQEGNHDQTCPSCLKKEEEKEEVVFVAGPPEPLAEDDYEVMPPA